MSTSSTEFMSVRFVDIDAEQAGQRVDNFLITYLKGVPKSRIYRILRKGEVRVNKGRIKPDYKLRAGDSIRIPPIVVSMGKPSPKPGASLVRLLEQSTLYESDALLVINKPSGLAVHGGSGISLGLIEALREMRPEARFLELVHRLDRDTSGCIMIAKKRSLLRHLQAQLREGRVSKVYNALVAGRWLKGCTKDERTKIEAPLRKYELESGERMVQVDPQGKPSLTWFRVLSRYEVCTLLEVKPVTGRTHQIRVHALHAGHRLIGDEKYGDKELNKTMKKMGFNRLFLHATQLSFYLPGEDKSTVISAPLSEDLTKPLLGLTTI